MAKVKISKDYRYVAIDSSVILDPDIPDSTKKVYVFICCLTEEDLEKMDLSDFMKILEMKEHEVLTALGFLNKIDLIGLEA